MSSNLPKCTIEATHSIGTTGNWSRNEEDTCKFTMITKIATYKAIHVYIVYTLWLVCTTSTSRLHLPPSPSSFISLLRLPPSSSSFIFLLHLPPSSPSFISLLRLPLSDFSFIFLLYFCYL